MARGNKKIVDQTHDLYRKANSTSRRKWENTSQQSYEFFLGEQLTEDEQDELRSAGMPNFTVNRITPVIEMMKFFATANTPRWQAVGAEGSDSDVAAVHSDIADYCWYNSNGDSIYAQVIQDSLVKGVGYIQVDVDPNQDRGLGEVVFKRVEPFDVYPDPTSRDFLFRDASYVMIRKDLPKSQIEKLFPSKKRQINSANSDSAGQNNYSNRDALETDLIFPADSAGDSYDSTGEESPIVDYYECYSKEKISFMNVFINMPPGPDEMEELKKEVEINLKDYEAEMMVQIEEKALQLAESVQKGEIIEERAQLEIERARREAFAGIEQQKMIVLNKLKEKESKIENRVMLKEEYDILMEDKQIADTIVDAIDFYEDRIRLTIVVGDKLLYNQVLPIKDYPIIPFVYQYTGTPFPVSAVSPLVGKQQELNKAHQILIHNANLASNLRWMYEEGSVPEDEWEKYSSAPGALLKYRQGFTPPTPVQPLPLNQAFYGITQNARQDMEYVAGVYSSMQGDTGSGPETYRGLLQMDEYGTRRIKQWMQNVIEPALEHLGMIFKDWAQDTYLAHKVFRIVQPNNINEEKVVEINVPIFNDFGDSINKWNDYATAQFDVRIIGGSTLPLNRWALLEEYFKWYQSGLIDDIAMLQETDVRNKEAIIKRKSVYMQLRNKLEEMESLVKDRNGTIETLERQLVQSGIKQKVQDADMSIQKDVLESEAAQSSYRDKLKNETNTKMKELGMAIGARQREIESSKPDAKE
tara:strand:+ start:845 stop:3106 length:2262 start_codon:yes stop_codon:yes gene_type:complete